MDELRTNDRRDKVALIARPGEWRLRDPVLEIHRSDGSATMWICVAEF
jgi:hypothetical protein